MKEIHTFGLLSCTDCFRIPNPRNRDCRMVVAGVAISVGSYSVIYPSPLCYGAQPLLALSRARHAPTKTGCQLAFKQQPQLCARVANRISYNNQKATSTPKVMLARWGRFVRRSTRLTRPLRVFPRTRNASTSSNEYAANTTIFGKILRREIPADIVHEDEWCIAFKDVAPVAPEHLLVIPKKHISRVSPRTDAEKAMLVDCGMSDSCPNARAHRFPKPRTRTKTSLDIY